MGERHPIDMDIDEEYVLELYDMTLQEAADSMFCGEKV